MVPFVGIVNADPSDTVMPDPLIRKLVELIVNPLVVTVPVPSKIKVVLKNSVTDVPSVKLPPIVSVLSLLLCVTPPTKPVASIDLQAIALVRVIVVADALLLIVHVLVSSEVAIKPD
jgi:hypothetical protein